MPSKSTPTVQRASNCGNPGTDPHPRLFGFSALSVAVLPTLQARSSCSRRVPTVGQHSLRSTAPTASAPWLVFFAHHTLTSLQWPLTWPDCRADLIQLLLALRVNKFFTTKKDPAARRRRVLPQPVRVEFCKSIASPDVACPSLST